MGYKMTTVKSSRYTTLWKLSSIDGVAESLNSTDVEIYEFFRNVREDVLGPEKERAMKIVEAISEEDVPDKLKAEKFDALAHLFMYAMCDEEEGAIPRDVFDGVTEKYGMNEEAGSEVNADIQEESDAEDMVVAASE